MGEWTFDEHFWLFVCSFERVFFCFSANHHRTINQFYTINLVCGMRCVRWKSVGLSTAIRIGGLEVGDTHCTRITCMPVGIRFRVVGFEYYSIVVIWFESHWIFKCIHLQFILKTVIFILSFSSISFIHFNFMLWKQSIISKHSLRILWSETNQTAECVCVFVPVK